MANQQFDERTLLSNNIRFGSEEGTDIQVMTSTTTPNTRVDSMFAANYDSIPHTLILGFQGGTLIYPFAIVPLPAAVDGVPSFVNVMSMAFAGQQAAIFLTYNPLAGRLLEAATSNDTPVSFIYFGGIV